MKCKECGNDIRFTIIPQSKEYAVSCGSIDCMNIAFFEDKEKATVYARELSDEKS